DTHTLSLHSALPIYFLVRDLERIVDAGAFEVAGHAALADAFGNRASGRLQLAVFDPAVDRGADWIRCSDHDAWITLLQKLADPGERSARAHSAGEAVHAAPGLRPDLGSRARDVALAVRTVVPLIRVQHAVRLGPRELLGGPGGDVHVVVRVAVRHRRNLAQLGAAESKRVLFLLRLRIRHQDERAIAARIAD